MSFERKLIGFDAILEQKELVLHLVEPNGQSALAPLEFFDPRLEFLDLFFHLLARSFRSLMGTSRPGEDDEPGPPHEP